jgi:hypothetical protein
VLAAFGWRASRPDPVTDRESAANSLQPAILSNGTRGTWVRRWSPEDVVTAMADEAKSPDALTDDLFLRLLSRRPTAAEKAKYSAYLGEGFARRLLAPPIKPIFYPRKPAYYVSWSNHLNDMATTVRMQEEAAARKGDPATHRLFPAWRRRAEDVVWALVNSPEFLYN